MVKDKTYNNLLPSVNYTFLQTTLLVMNHGFDIILPAWVLWFPTIIYGIVTGIILIILLIAFILSLL